MNKNKKPLKIKNGGYKKEKDSREQVDLQENPQYTGIANKIAWGKSILIVLLIFGVVAAFIANIGNLSVSKFNNFLKTVNIFGSEAAGKPEFYIDLDDSSTVCYYKNSIAAIRRNMLDIYNLNGRLLDQSPLNYSNPVLKTSERYIIAYDLGTNKMEIFDYILSQVYKYKGDRPIYSASVTNKGNVVYITSERRYKSEVYVMDSRFEVIFGCGFGEDYVTAATIDDGAALLAVAGFTARDGDYLGTISLYDVREQQLLWAIETAGERPYSVKVGENSVFAVFDNSLKIYDFSGNAVVNYNFEGRKIRAMALTSAFAAVALSEKTLGTADSILIFDGGGDRVYENTVAGEVRDMKFSEGHEFLYLLTREGLSKIDPGEKTLEFVAGSYDETANKIVYADGKKIYLAGRAKIISVDAEQK